MYAKWWIITEIKDLNASTELIISNEIKDNQDLLENTNNIGLKSRRF